MKSSGLELLFRNWGRYFRCRGAGHYLDSWVPTREPEHNTDFHPPRSHSSPAAPEWPDGFARGPSTGVTAKAVPGPESRKATKCLLCCCSSFHMQMR